MKTRVNTERAERVIRFIELLIVPSGEGEGRPIQLNEFQKEFIRDVYSPEYYHEESGTWRRLVRRAILSVARKNGKTALSSGLALAHLVGPEAEKNGEIFSAATEREQAAEVYKMASQMVRADPDLNQFVKLIDSTTRMVSYHNGSYYKAFSRDAGTKHGKNPSFVIYDELAQAKNRDLYDALDTSMGARKEPLMLIISTQNPDSQHILSELIDDGLDSGDPTTVCHLYEADEDADVLDEAGWHDANPALGAFRSVEDVRSLALKADRLPSFEAAFRNLYMNQRVSSETPLIPRSEWAACAGAAPLEPGEQIYIAADLSATTDLTALVAVSAENGDRVAAWFWKPQDLLEEHEKRDRAPYRKWVKEGYLEAAPGRVVRYDFVAAKIAEIVSMYDVLGFSYDRWRIELLIKELDYMGLDCYAEKLDTPRAGALRLVPFGQGYRDMSPAVEATEMSVLSGKFSHPENPVLTFCFANAIAVSDPAGLRKLDKSKTRFRIDGAVATAMAIGLKYRDLDSGPATVEYNLGDMFS